MTMTATSKDCMQSPARSGTARHADAYTARQVMVLKDTIARHETLLDGLLGGTSQCSSEPMRPGQIRLFDEAALDARIDGVKSTLERVLKDELQKARALGPLRSLATCPSAAALNALEHDFPHCAEVVQLLRQRAALSTLSPGGVYALPPMLLAGPPGVGKTAFSEAVARCLEVPTRRIDMAAATASFVLSGSNSSWSSGRHGAIWSLLQSPTASGLVLLDEIDKASSGNYPVTGPLYRLIEPASAKTFVDEYVEVEVDASHLLWIATCNDIDAVEPALRSRFLVFDVPAPSAAQMPAVAQSVYRGRRAQATWGAAFPEQLAPMVAEQFAQCTPRDLSRLIDSAAAHAASCLQSQIRVTDVHAAQQGLGARARSKARIGFI